MPERDGKDEGEDGPKQAGSRGSTIGEGVDTTISSPGLSPKQPLPGIELHNPLHDWQACPEFIAFTKGVVKYVTGRGYFRGGSSQNGENVVTSPPPPQSLNGSPRTGSLAIVD